MELKVIQKPLVQLYPDGVAILVMLERAPVLGPDDMRHSLPTLPRCTSRSDPAGTLIDRVGRASFSFRLGVGPFKFVPCLFGRDDRLPKYP